MKLIQPYVFKFKDVKKEENNFFYKEHQGYNGHVTVEQGYQWVDIRKQ